MQVMDIINRAVMKSGVVSSFNPDEVPEDIQQRAADVLRNEIIFDLNCDRAVDVSETVITFRPKRGVVDLITTPLDYEHYIVGSVPETYDELRHKEPFVAPGIDAYYYPNIRALLATLGYATPGMPTTIGTRTDKWPTDQFGNYREVYAWTSDFKLVCLSKPSSQTAEINDELLDARYNVPFYPAYIDEVYRAGDGAPLQYLHHGEMVSAEFRHSQLVYTIEDNITRMTVRFNPCFGDASVMLVLPVPVKVLNSFEEPNPWEGEVIAPMKFFSFLVNMLAWRMAAEYGVDTKAEMKELSTTSYINIIKNKVKREHPQDIERRIFHYLRRARGFRTGVGGNGYSGGFYG